MLIIADNLTVTNPLVARVLAERDGPTLRRLVKLLREAGAEALDLNIGFARKDGPELAAWLIQEVSRATSLPLVLDTANPAAMRAGLEAAAVLDRPPPLINCYSLDPVKSSEILPLAAEFAAEIVGYCVREVVPQTPEERLEVAMELVSLADLAGVPRDRIYLDPILFPFASFQADIQRVLEFLRFLPELFAPPVRSMAALSNFGHGLPGEARKMAEAVLLPMLLEIGVDAVLLDALDPHLASSRTVIKGIRQEIVFSAADLARANRTAAAIDRPNDQV